MIEWSFITNHARVFAVIARYPRRTIREIGDAAGITERATHKIIKDLEMAGYVTKVKIGRRNEYEIQPDTSLKEKIIDTTVRELLVMLGWKPRKSQSKTASAKQAKI